MRDPWHIRVLDVDPVHVADENTALVLGLDWAMLSALALVLTVALLGGTLTLGAGYGLAWLVGHLEGHYARLVASAALLGAVLVGFAGLFALWRVLFALLW